MFVEMVHHPTTKGEILMKKRVLSALMALLLLIPAAGSAEEAPMLLESYASRGARQVTFAYPEGCTVEVEDKIGTMVFMDDETYVVVVVTHKGSSGIDEIREAIGDSSLIFALTDGMHLYATHGMLNYPLLTNYDYVEVGLNLPGGVDVVVASQCLYGDTAVYDLLLTIVGSLTDAAPLQTWLEETWIPTVMQE